MLSKIPREPRELPWQPNLGKNKPKLHWFQFYARNRGIYHIIKRFSRSTNSNMVYKILWESGRLPWQPNLNKNKPKLHWFQFGARNRGLFCMKSQVFGSATSNMLYQFLRELRELLWQPNLEKNKPKLHKFPFLARNRGIFRMFSSVFMGFVNSNFHRSW